MAKSNGIPYSVVFHALERKQNDEIYATFNNAAGRKVAIALSENQLYQYLSGEEPMPYQISDDQLIRAIGAFRQKPGKKPRP